MAKFLCECGNTIRISGDIPNPQEWLLISDVSFERFDYSGQADVADVYASMQHAFLCETCSRLYVFWNGIADGWPPTEYVPNRP